MIAWGNSDVVGLLRPRVATAVTAAQWGDGHVCTQMYCLHAKAVRMAEWPEHSDSCTWTFVNWGGGISTRCLDVMHQQCMA